MRTKNTSIVTLLIQVVPAVRPQQHDVGDDVEGEGGKLVGENYSEAPAVFPLVASEAARRPRYFRDVVSRARNRECSAFCSAMRFPFT